MTCFGCFTNYTGSKVLGFWCIIAFLCSFVDFVIYWPFFFATLVQYGGSSIAFALQLSKDTADHRKYFFVTYMVGIVLVTILYPLCYWYYYEDLYYGGGEFILSTGITVGIRLVFQIHFIFVLKENWISLRDNRPDAF